MLYHKVLNSNYLLASENNDSEFLLFDKTDNIIHFVVNYVKKRTFKFEKDISIFYDNKIIVTDGYSFSKKNHLSIYNLENLNYPVWQYKLPIDFIISGKLQILKNILFFTAYRKVNEYKKVIGIDLESGRVIWELNYQVPYDENLVATIQDEQNGLCYGYFGNKYQVFDPVKGKMLFEKDMTSYYEKGVLPTKNSIYKNKLWFVSGEGESVKFGAINLETSEIEFIQDFPLEDDEQLDSPVFHDGKLYLRGLHDNTLHIFEKEETI